MIIVAFSTIGTRLRASSGRRSGNELHVRSRMSARTSSAARVTQARRSSPHHVGHDGAALATCRPSRRPGGEPLQPAPTVGCVGDRPPPGRGGRRRTRYTRRAVDRPHSFGGSVYLSMPLPPRVSGLPMFGVGGGGGGGEDGCGDPLDVVLSAMVTRLYLRAGPPRERPRGPARWRRRRTP
jgi:hypothetical protein